MNPRAGDTVISTKSNATSNTNPPTTTVMMTTKITTGQRATGRPAAAAAAGGSTSRASTRKRGRQQAEEPPHRPAKAATTRATTMARPEATVVQPPEKSRRRSDPRRLGDFFSNLASRMRGPKAADATRCQENEDNRQNGATEVVPIVSMKREVNSESAENMDADFNKRRKIEHDEPGDVSSCDSASSHNSVSPDVDSIKIDESDSAIVYSDSDLISSENLQIRNTDKAAENSVNFKIEKYETTAAVSKCNSGESSTQEITKDSENAEQIIDMCRSIVASMCEKIQEASGDSNASRTRANSPEPRSAKITLSSNTICIEDSSVEPSECHQQPGIKVVIDEDKDPTESPSATMRPSRSLPRRDEATRLRKNIQWMEEGARRLREELAEVRSQLHEERRAAKLARREFETAVRETRNAEATRHGQVIAELKARLSQSPSRAAVDSAPSTSKSELLKDENHRREVAALKKRLAEAEATIQKLKTNTLERAGRGTKRRNTGDEGPSTAETRKLEIEVQTLRAANKMLEERLHIAEESARARAAELRMQHESHETELSTLQKALRSDTIKMMDEIQSKNREIEKLERLVSESAQTNEKLRAQEGETMRKLRESERSHQIRLAPKFEEKIRHDDRMVELCKAELEEAETAATELERLRELVEEQQEVIEVLRQAVKEKERKLDQMWNKRRKEEYYRKWIQLEPVVEDEDEDEHEDGTGSSFSPQPRGLMQHFNGVSRDAYESVLLEIEELQIQLMEEQQELRHARSQIRELERALLQETRGSATSRRALSEKLRKAEDREACLIAELTELREQNELLEFRVLELEESPNPRDTPDPADSGIVSPEPIHLYKDHQNIKNRDRAVATVIPYTSTYTNQLLSSDPHKAPLSLQESGIFEEDEVDGVEEEQHMTEQNKQHYSSVEVASQSTQTEAPAGELLQEVQRLQELRARIQERGAKSLPPSSPLSDRKNEVACEAAFDIAPLRERIRELEERISNFEADREVSKQREEELLDENYRLTEKTYWQESELKKLQEKLNEVKLTSDAQTMTEDSVVRQMVQKIESRQCLDEVDKPQEEDPLMTRCQRLYKNVIQNMDRDAATPSGSDDCTSGYGSEAASSIKDQPCLDCSDLWKDCDARIRNLSRTEFCLRQQISSMEQQKNAFFGILREADASWAKLESEYESKQKEMNERLSAQVELNRALFEHLTQLNKAKIAEEEANNVEMMDDEPMDVEDNMVETSKAIATQTDEVEAVPCRCQWTKSLSRSSLSATSTGVIIRTDANRVSTISRTNIKLPTATAGCDEPDTHGLPTSTVSTIKVESLPEVAIEAKEEDETLARAAGGVSITQDQQEQQPEPLVSIDKSSDDKKQIIYFRWR